MDPNELKEEAAAMEAEAGQTTPGGASVSEDAGAPAGDGAEDGADAGEPGAGTPKTDNTPAKAGAPAPAATEDFEIPEALRAKFGGATKVSEIWAKAEAARTLEQDYQRVGQYALRKEQELEALRAQQAAATVALGAGAAPKSRFPGFESDAAFQAAYKADPFAALFTAFEAKMLANPKFSEQIDGRVKQGIQPLVQTEEQRQEQAFTQHLNGQFKALYTADARFTPPSPTAPQGGELYGAADKFFTQNEQWLRQRALQEPGFNPFEFTARYVAGEVAQAQLKATNTKMDGIRKQAGTASPATGAGVLPRSKGSGGTAFDDVAEVEAENPELAAELTPAERRRFAQMLDQS